MQSHGSDVHVIHSTFSGSLPSLISTFDNWNTTLSIENSILWNPKLFWTPQFANFGSSTTSVRYSDVRGGFPGDGNISADLRFVSGTDLRLRTGSPCLDAADSDVGPAADIAGLSRVDDPSRGNTGVGRVDYADMGAHERQP